MEGTMPATLENDLYISRFAALEKESAHLPAWLTDLKRAAIGRFAEIGFPRTSQEEWRFTNVAPIANTVFRPAPAAAHAFTSGRLAQLTFAAPGEFRVVFVNGRYSPELSSPVQSAPAGLQFMTLARAVETAPGLVRPSLGRVVEFGATAFVALNTALMEDGVFLRVADGAVIERPVHIVHATFAPAPG